MITYIVGHKKPDLDATVSAMSVAKFRSLRGDMNPTAVVTEAINPETEFVFKKFKATPPPIIDSASIKPEDKFVLVDHNESDQRLDGINETQISAIIDHHKVNLNLPAPIKITIMPVGSTNTIVYLKFKQYGFEIEPQLAQLMLSAVLSDTVGLKSSTTTDKDREAVADLAKIAGITDIPSLTLEIFKAKSNISSMTPEQIVKNDYKIFEFKQKTFIGQIETVEQAEIIANKKQQLVDALNSVKQSEGVGLIFLAITDILNVNTKVLTTSPEEIAILEKAFGVKAVEGVVDIGAKMSRKKDIAPPIEAAL